MQKALLLYSSIINSSLYVLTLLPHPLLFLPTLPPRLYVCLPVVPYDIQLRAYCTVHRVDSLVVRIVPDRVSTLLHPLLLLPTDAPTASLSLAHPPPSPPQIAIIHDTRRRAHHISPSAEHRYSGLLRWRWSWRASSASASCWLPVMSS